MPADLVDERKILTDLSERAIDRLLTKGEKLVREYWARWKNRDAAVYGTYLAHRGATLRNVRNIIYSDRSASLADVYVPVHFVDNDRSDEGFIKWFCQNNVDPDNRPTRSAGITASAGAGKSLFMRYAFFKIQEGGTGRIPIFLEARSFNRVKVSSLETCIYENFGALGIQIFPEQITAGLQSGLFAILIDGIDEIKISVEAHYINEIRSAIVKYRECPFLLSSRPGNFGIKTSLDAVFRIKRMTKDLTIQLIKRLEFEESIKDKFVNLLEARLYNTHYDFVSNPLLCTIMLLTFSDSGRISNRTHEFYEDAFSALWFKHDIRKEGYEREKRSRLEKREFQRLIAAFSMSSYVCEYFEFRESDFRRFFRQAIELSGIVCKEDEILYDLTISTCLMLEDGPYFTFFHRSFQEYFAAAFLLDADDAVIEGLVDGLAERIETDNVIQLALSMSPEKIERNWTLKKINKIDSAISDCSGNIGQYAVMVSQVGNFEASEAEIMRKLRLLYQLNPDSSKLLAAYDATRHMGQKIEKSAQKLFEEDRSNFTKFSQKLRGKYTSKASALQILLRKSAPGPSKKDAPIG